MGLFDNELGIDEQDSFKNDKLQRKQEIENLTSVFNAVDNKMVLAINSEWGTGKTTFLKMWNQYLKGKEYKTIFFNAWENDYVEDAFIAFVEEIRESVNDESKVKGFIEKAKNVGVALAKQTPKIASKMIKDKIGFDTEEFISNDELSQIISDKIDNYNKNKKSVCEFKKELEKIANGDLEEGEKDKKPMIIFVDELDRCRPDYAISLLERIKHLFNVQNIIFILGIDKEALSNSIKVIYGEQTDVNGYLTRFIDLEYKLNDIKKVDYINFLLEKYKFKQIFDERKKCNFKSHDEENNYIEFCEIVKEFMLNFNLSLRDCEKIIVKLCLILKVRHNKYIRTYLCIFLLILKKLNNILYYKIKIGNVTYDEIEQQFSKNKKLGIWFNDFCKRGYILKAYIIWLLDDKIELEKIKNNVDKDNAYKDPNSLCVDCYERINKESGFWNINKQNIFQEIDLYDNLTTLDKE